MRIVKTVIGLALRLIQLVMRVRPTQGIPNGGNSNTAVDTQPPQPAKTSQTRKRKPAQAVTKVQSQKPAQKTASQTNGQRGNKQVTPAQQSSQQKPKPLPAQSIKAVKSSKQEQSQPTLRGRGKQSVTPAPKTRQVGQQQQTQKQKVADCTTQGKKHTQKSTPAQTLTVRKSKAHGR